MKAGALWILTALITGLPNFYWLMNVFLGASINLSNCMGLLGSAMLLVAAVLAPLRPRAAAKVGLVGSLLLWVFYAPLIVVSLMMPFSTRLQIRSFISFHDYVSFIGMLFGPILSDCLHGELDSLV